MPKLKSTYGYKPGGGRGIPADVAFRELERIRKTTGELRPETVVATAAAVDNPLHPAFEWDDATAGQSFRLMQARTLIRSVTVTVEGTQPRSVYVHVATLGQRAGDYQPMEVVVTHPDRFATALAELVRRLQSAEEAVAELQRLAEGGPEDRQARIVIAMQAFRAATEAVRALH